MTTAARNLAFVGIGKMGLPMLEHLVRAGHRVTAFDAGAAGIAAAKVVGARTAADVASCIAGAEVILSSLPNDAAFAAVGREIAARGTRGQIYVDTSTVSPAISASVAAALAPAGIEFIRSTVSGNPVVARAANLTVMASGPQAAYESVRPLLSCFGKTHFHLGAAEEARAMKLVINLLVAGTAGLMGEALALGEKAGLDWAQMLDIMGGSAAGSPMVNYKVAPLKARDYASTFSGLQMIKDLDLILGEGARVGVPLAMTAHLRQVYESIAAQGDGELDYIATVRHVERLAGIDHGR